MTDDPAASLTWLLTNSLPTCWNTILFPALLAGGIINLLVVCMTPPRPEEER